MGIDPDALKRLVQDYDIDPDYDMQQALCAAGSMYSILSGMPKDQGAQKKQLSRLAKKAHQLVDAIDEFEDVLSGFDSFPRSPADPVRLSRYDPIIQQVVDNWKLHVKKQRRLVREDGDKWASSADHALAGIGRLKTGGGDMAFNDLIYKLIDLYAASTGEEPAYPSVSDWRGADTRKGGPMLGFVAGCLDILGVDKKTNQALGSRIDRILGSRKK